MIKIIFVLDEKHYNGTPLLECDYYLVIRRKQRRTFFVFFLDSCAAISIIN